MPEISTKTFTCEICGKEFDESKAVLMRSTESRLKVIERPKIRHASYCRKRLRDPPQPRKKSCVTCTKAKISCDRIRHNPCSTCIRKGRVCVYEERRRSTSSAGYKDASSSASGAASIRSSTGQEAPVEKYRALTARPPVAVKANKGTSQNSQDSKLSLIQTVQSRGTPLGAVSWPIATFRFDDPISIMASTEQAISVQSMHILSPGSISHELPLRPYQAFNTRLSKRSQSSLLTKYIISTLCSYSRMNIGEGQLPPFIHPEGVRQGKKLMPCSMLDRLTACSAITTWWSKNTEDRKFMWNVIRMEQERLFEECVGGVYDDWQAVVALQAICVYLLLRLVESDEEKTTFDIPLIRTMSKITARVQGLTAKYSNLCDGDSAWEHWILVESLRRTLIVILIIGYLFDMTPGYEQLDCADDKYLLEMLLPSTASLWNANTREEWQQKYIDGKSRSRQQRCVGDLFRHAEQLGGAESGLESWLGDVDGLGTLVIAVATLAKTR